MSKPYIGIKRLWYGNPLAADLKKLSDVTALLSTFTEIKNVHNDTWDYSQDDPDTNDYVNQLTGLPYYTDKTTQGNKTISFTLGVYSYEDKVALQGGTLIKDQDATVGWKSSDTIENIHKAIIGQTKTGNYVVFSNANIIGKVDKQDANLGLGVQAVANASVTEGVSDEYWFEATAG